MSDSASEFWGYYIAAIALVDIVWCIWPLFSQRRVQVAPRHNIGEGTDHVWDGDLRELNNLLPRRWMWTFPLSCTFVLGYLTPYPDLGAYGGALSFSTRGELASQRAAADAQVHLLCKHYAGMGVRQIVAGPQAHETSQHPFLNNYTQCRGSDAGGSKGFPSLTNNDWPYNGEPKTILTGITKRRHGVMPSLTTAMDGNQAVNVANYVRSLSDLTYDPIKAVRGEPTFKSVRAACHTATGKGSQALDASNLADRVQLYGNSGATVVETILKGRNNTTPAHESLFPSEKIHVLATYV